MTRFATVALLVLLAVPAAFAVPPGGDAQQTPAAQNCKEQRRSMGMADFRSLYAPNGKPKAAMDACLAKQAQSSSTEAKNASKACKAEREKLGDVEFAKKYGTNANGRNAHGKCVSALAAAESEEAQEETLNAAKKCKAERTSLGAEEFAKKYGTNANKRNAFGKCVSKHAKGDD
jgi:hypothetical protein